MHRFDDVEIDEHAQELRVAGEPRSIEPQVFSVLTYLIGQRHRVVPKEELLDEVWGSRFVSAAAITSRIKSARQAIGDSGREQRCIRTVHGRGYRFVAAIDGAAPTDAGDLSSPVPTLHEPAARTLDEGWPLMGRDTELGLAVGAVGRGERGGMLLSGPAGLGKTRLARAIIEAVSNDGVPVARINGHAGATSVPLAALAHLLPADVTETAGLQGELARTVLFQRARSAISDLAGGERLVLMVDDVDRIDALSQALIGSLITGRSVFAVMTQRADGDDDLAMGHLVRSDEVTHVRLGPVQADQLTALLGRVLDGPVKPNSAESLVAASAGNPGVLRQLVEASTASGSLVRRAGLWRLTGPVAAPGDMAAAIAERLSDLDADQRDALELLALAGDLDLDLAFELIADEVLDRLELEGMISVREIGSTARIRVAHPLYGEILTANVTPLRDRRHRERLATTLAAREPTNAADRLQLVRLQLEGDADIDDEMLVESAALALIEGDTGLTLRLLERVPGERRTAHHQQLLGETLYMRGRFAQAGDVWQRIDLAELDTDAAAFVVRRITTFMFYGSWRHNEALEYLDAHIDRFTGAPRALLDSYWVMISGLDGRNGARTLDRAATGLPGSTGHPRVDYLSGAAMAHFLRGEFRTAIELLDECGQVIETLERSLTWTGSAFADFVEIMAHTQLGETATAAASLDRFTGRGDGPPFGFVAIAAGRLALVTGQYQQVLDWLDPHIQIADALGIITNGRPLQASSAVAALELGDHERARREAEVLRADLPEVVNLTALDIQWALLKIEAALGDRDAAADGLVASAATARSADNRYIESLMLTAAIHAGAADRVVDRLADLTEVMHGAVIGLRHRAALAALQRDDAGAVADELGALGFHFEAAQLRRTCS